MGRRHLPHSFKPAVSASTSSVRQPGTRLDAVGRIPSVVAATARRLQRDRRWRWVL